MNKNRTRDLTCLSKKRTYSLHERLFVVAQVAPCCQTHRVARKVAFIEELARTEGIPDDIPGEAEQLNAFSGRGGCRLIIPLDVGTQGAGKVALTRSHHVATGPEELQNL